MSGRFARRRGRSKMVSAKDIRESLDVVHNLNPVPVKKSPKKRYSVQAISNKPLLPDTSSLNKFSSLL
jgi:hypothetical protein